MEPGGKTVTYFLTLEWPINSEAQIIIFFNNDTCDMKLDLQFVASGRVVKTKRFSG